MKTIFFMYKRDDKLRPRCTVCLRYDPVNKVFHRGVAICAPADYGFLAKRTGRQIAFDRALFAEKVLHQAQHINYLKRVNSDLVRQFGYITLYTSGLPPSYLHNWEAAEIIKQLLEYEQRMEARSKKGETQKGPVNVSLDGLKEHVPYVVTVSEAYSPYLCHAASWNACEGEQI